jgi:hypothetical protein
MSLSFCATSSSSDSQPVSTDPIPPVKMQLILPVILPIFFSSTLAFNPLFLSTQYPECNSCLDATYLSCPGFYEDRDYATCMCAGTGATNMNTCISICDSVDALGVGLGIQKAEAWYGYCVQFFREMCDEAKPFLDSEQWEENCGPNAGPGVGEEVTSTGVATL